MENLVQCKALHPYYLYGTKYSKSWVTKSFECKVKLHYIVSSTARLLRNKILSSATLCAYNERKML